MLNKCIMFSKPEIIGPKIVISTLTKIIVITIFSIIYQPHSQGTRVTELSKHNDQNHAYRRPQQEQRRRGGDVFLWACSAHVLRGGYYDCHFSQLERNPLNAWITCLPCSYPLKTIFLVRHKNLEVPVALLKKSQEVFQHVAWELSIFFLLSPRQQRC